MRLTIINASPRKRGSNTKLVLEPFIKGFLMNNGNSVEEFYCSELDNDESAEKIFSTSETILLAFPLYSYGLPPLASRFVHRLQVFKGVENKVKMAFLCQYGFSEACHARSLERQLQLMCRSLEIENLGMLLKGGCEGTRLKPASWNRKLFSGFEEIGKSFGEMKKFDQVQLNRFSAPERANSGGLLKTFFNHFNVFFGNNFFWKAELKKHNALKMHWAQPLLME